MKRAFEQIQPQRSLQEKIKSIAIKYLKTLEAYRPTPPDTDDEAYNRYRDNEAFRFINRLPDAEQQTLLMDLIASEHVSDEMLAEYYTVHPNAEQNMLDKMDEHGRLPIWHALKHLKTKTLLAMIQTKNNPTQEGRLIVRYDHGMNDRPIFLSAQLFLPQEATRRATPGAIHYLTFQIEDLAKLLMPHFFENDLKDLSTFLVTNTPSRPWEQPNTECTWLLAFAERLNKIRKPVTVSVGVQTDKNITANSMK